MKILVTYGSARGGTEELAQMVADGLHDEGFAVALLPPHQVKGFDEYGAVVVGGALYAFRWHRAARRFVKHHSRELQARPTYFFSSGPLDDSAAKGDIPPVKGVQALMERVGARGHVTFGGRLSPDARGFPASAMAKKHGGDWRDAELVREWVRSIAPELRTVLGAADAGYPGDAAPRPTQPTR
jgi:menaquinone-dependent protoporphyrinogen oxidase